MENAIDQAVVSERLLSVVAEQTGIARSRLKMEACLHQDLRLAGDDVFELLERLHKEFSIDFSNMRFDRHFASEVGTLGDLIWMIAGVVPVFAFMFGLDTIIGELNKYVAMLAAAPAMFGWLWLGQFRPSARRWRQNRIPVTINDLVVAANTKQWPIGYDGR